MYFQKGKFKDKIIMEASLNYNYKTNNLLLIRLIIFHNKGTCPREGNLGIKGFANLMARIVKLALLDTCEMLVVRV